MQVWHSAFKEYGRWYNVMFDYQVVAQDVHKLDAYKYSQWNSENKPL